MEESVNPEIRLRTKLHRLEDEIRENENHERNLYEALNVVKKKLNSMRTQSHLLGHEINQKKKHEEKLFGRLNKNGVKKKIIFLRNELCRLDDDIEEKENQEEELSCASYGIRKEIQKVKDEREMLQKEIDVTKSQLKKPKQHFKSVKLKQQFKSEKLRPQLSACLQNIRLTSQNKYSSILQTALPLVVESMKKANCLFERMYRCPVYTDSYFEELRIIDAGEFDINLVLDLPVEVDNVQISPRNPPSASLRLQRPVEAFDIDENEESELRYLLDDDAVHVMPGQMLRWFQRVVDQAKLTDLVIEGVEEISFTGSGPARTLQIALYGPVKTFISVNLVPVFKIFYFDWLPGLEDVGKEVVNVTLMKDRNLYLVPKTYKLGTKQTPCETAKEDIPILWSMQFYDIEKSILTYKSEARTVIKLLKLLRDSQRWGSLHSYYLKTLVLNDIVDKPGKEWNQSSFHQRLLEMLAKLKHCLDEYSMPHVFFRNVNLFQSMKFAEMKQISEKMDEVMKIEQDPSLVQKYFKV